MQIVSAKQLTVYCKAYQLAMEVLRVSSRFPRDERYALSDQIRRATRSVCANLREAWAKRRYRAHFLSKLTDCDGENAETDTWLDFAHDAGYLDEAQFQCLSGLNREVGLMLGRMIREPDKFLISPHN